MQQEPEQLTIGGLPPAPPKRAPGRPSKVDAVAHAQAVRKAVMSGARKRNRSAVHRKNLGEILRAWTERACALVLEYGHTAGSAGFLMEEAIAYAKGKGLDAPPDPRDWGRVPLTLKAAGKLEACGVGRATSSNGSWKVKWRCV